MWRVQFKECADRHGTYMYENDWIKSSKWTSAKPGFADLIIFLNNGYMYFQKSQDGAKLNESLQCARVSRNTELKELFY